MSTFVSNPLEGTTSSLSAPFKFLSLIKDMSCFEIGELLRKLNDGYYCIDVFKKMLKRVLENVHLRKNG